VWSRVQNQCTYADASNNVYQSVYIPLTKQTVTLAQANYEDKLLQKGNILQYKGNSSQLTKKQKYSQLAKGFGPNRTKVFATQSETYTNPNTTGLLRVNSTTLPFPNDLVGQPNNISGPFQYAVPNPNGCTGLSIQDGGNLVCGTYANPCTGEILQTGAKSSVICNPASASNVPGSATLCWDTKVQTWFPRQRYFMNNSGTKWPQGYKGFVSAVTPEAPVLTLDSETSTTVTVSWANADSICLQISSYRLYVDDQLFTTVPYQINSYTFFKSSCSSSVYVTAVSNNVESEKSNTIIYSGTGILAAPTLTLASSSTTANATIQWTEPATCAIVTGYNIYIKGGVTSVPSSPLSYSFSVDPSGNDVYIRALSDGVESPASNTIFVPGIGFTITGGGTFSYDATLNNYVITFTANGDLIVYPKNFASGLSVNAVLVGGGGGGAGGGAGGVLINRGAGGGGGGGTIGNYDSFIPQTFPTITLTATIGAGGAGGAADAGGGAGPGAGTQGGTTFATLPHPYSSFGGGRGQIGEDSLGFGTGGNGGSSEGAGGIGGAGDGGNAPAGGGGGGAGGASLSSGGNGAENIFATTYPYVPDRGAGGGGGVGNEGSTAGTGGNIYAGNGGSVATGGNGVSGTANYGGGGGGGKAGNVIPGTSGAGGNGGSGIAVFYFQKPA
jgi:hypothetical protein